MTYGSVIVNWLTIFPIGMPRDFASGDDVPDTGEPVRDQREAEHEEHQNDVGILRVSIHFRIKPNQTKQSGQFE